MEFSVCFEKEHQISFDINDIVVLGNGGHAGMCIASLKKQSFYKIRGKIVENIELINPKENIIGCDSMLPDFLNKLSSESKKKLILIHFDAVLYSSTLFTLFKFRHLYMHRTSSSFLSS